MDVREKLVELIEKASYECDEGTRDLWDMRQVADGIADYLIANGVTVQEWISVKDRKPTEADGTVWVCLVDRFPYSRKEPFVNAKHDGRITEAHYSQFSNRWYKDGAVLPDGVVTHWMEKAQPPKGE